MNELHRELAPISAEAWAEIDDEARSTLKPVLTARRLVDFEGPLGWGASAVPTGRIDILRERPAGARAALRRVKPLLELRIPFELSRAEIDSIGRGARDADLDAVAEAARNIAHAEDHAVFHGLTSADIQGVCEEAERVSLSEDYLQYPSAVAAGLAKLRMAGVGGPYALALGPRCYSGLMTTTHDGYPVIQHVQRLIESPILFAPAVDGAVLISTRGGDFELTVGRDFSIGYETHTAERVRLYLEESFTFRILRKEAAIWLTYGEG